MATRLTQTSPAGPGVGPARGMGCQRPAGGPGGGVDGAATESLLGVGPAQARAKAALTVSGSRLSLSLGPGSLWRSLSLGVQPTRTRT